MSSNPSDPNPPRTSGLLARLRGMMQDFRPTEASAEEEPLPELENTPTPPLAAPVETPPPLPDNGPASDQTIPLAAPVAAEEVVGEVLEAAPVAPAKWQCPICTASCEPKSEYCNDCGFHFPPNFQAAAAPTGGGAPAPTAGQRVQDRYVLGALLSERGGVCRFQATDHGGSPPESVVILRAELPPAAPLVADEVAEVEMATEVSDEDILPGFDEVPLTADLSAPIWPSLTWERNLLEAAAGPSIPAILDQFAENGYDYLVLECPNGRLLWDAWDDPDLSYTEKFGLLRQVAEALMKLHDAGAIIEGLRPDIIVVTDDGQVKLRDLCDLLPLPVPADAPIRATLYTAPELVVNAAGADARSDLYSFGAMIYALFMGRELVEKDFERQGMPKPFIPQFPDCHPAFGRLISKTFCRDLGYRFPSDEAARKDKTGFQELIGTLECVGKALDVTRLEISAWTTIGMIRTGNEDAFAFLHATESRLEDVSDCALILLADGMGGYEAGEVAAALAIQTARKLLVQQKPFRALAGGTAFPIEGLKEAQDVAEPVTVDQMKKILYDVLKETNRTVHTASRSGIGRRGMGCTLDVVWIDGKNVVVGHVGDSRTYHLHEGRLKQLTRDQTLVNRLVELGQLTPEEAEDHPRKNELQQAIGGQPTVEPGVYSATLKPGDWVVVCSDGVTNHIKDAELEEMLRKEAVSADQAARRLVNFANINGATDNSTIVAVRVV